MRTFLKKVLSTFLSALVAYLLFTLVLLLIFGVTLSVIEDAEPQVPDGSILVLDLGFVLTDTPREVTPEEIVQGLLGEDVPPAYSLRQLVGAIEAAGRDDRIRGMLLHGTTAAGSGMSLPAMREIRAGLEDFQKQRKPIHAYLVTGNSADYYLASVADEVVLNEAGGLLMAGLASERLFVKDAFEKYGIHADVVAVGDYKSVADMLTRREMSPSDREQTEELLNDLWTSMLEEMAESREMAVRGIESVVDRTAWIIEPGDAWENGLVDRIGFLDTVIEDLVAITGRNEETNSFEQIDMGVYKSTVKPKPAKEDGKTERIAVVYVEGPIVAGEGFPEEAGSSRISRFIRQARQDPEVRALVLRVNSPGGSVLGSEEIAREVSLAQAEMPVVVSMGGLAASGGYWVSAAADHIIAEPTTITGSIGVVVVSFDLRQLANNLGVTFDRVKTSPYADVWSPFRSKTEEEIGQLRETAEGIYEDFITLVAEGRDMPASSVRTLAGGRIWSGEDALEIGLVDAMGGLADAVDFAAEAAELGEDYFLEEYPKGRSFEDMIQDLLRAEVTIEGSRAAGLLGEVMERVETELKFLQTFRDPQMVYAILPWRVLVP